VYNVDEREAITNIAEAVTDQIDYYRPAVWKGVATHPDHEGYVACVRASHYYVNTDGWPTFKDTPKGRAWSLERDGKIVAAGVGLRKCGLHQGEAGPAVDRLCDAIEKKMKQPAVTTPVAAGKVTVEYDRDWTWVFFPSKPSEDIRARMKEMGGRWSRRYGGWYFMTHIPVSKFVWLGDVLVKGPPTEAEEIAAEFEEAVVKTEDHVKHPFSQDAILPEPLVDLDQVTLGQMLELAEKHPEEVKVRGTRGYGPYTGETFVRFYIKATVRYQARLYQKAETSGPIDEKRINARLKWSASIPHPMQTLSVLTLEHSMDVAAKPQLAAKADDLYAQLAEALSPEVLGYPSLPERVWLTLFDAVEGKKNFEPHFYHQEIQRVAAERFGIRRWTDLKIGEAPKAPLLFAQVSAPVGLDPMQMSMF